MVSKVLIIGIVILILVILAAVYLLNLLKGVNNSKSTTVSSGYNTSGYNQSGYNQSGYNQSGYNSSVPRQNGAT